MFSVFGGKTSYYSCVNAFFSVIRVSLVRDDLLQLKRAEPTNFKKLTAVFLFTVRPCRQPPDGVGVSSHTR